MALTAGTISNTSVASTSDVMTATAATSGTAPVTYQWYRSVVTAFTPGSGNLITGATALVLDDSGLIPGTLYYYKVIAIDAVPTTVTYAQVSAQTTAPVLNPNSFSLGPYVGMIDQRFPYNTIEARVDATQTVAVYPGQAMKFSASPAAGPGVPSLVACSADTDECMGFIVFDIKNQSYQAPVAPSSGGVPVQSQFELAQAGDVVYLYATAAITRGAQCVLDVTTIGGVQQASGASQNVVGWAYDGAAAGGTLIRVKLSSPSFVTA